MIRATSSPSPTAYGDGDASFRAAGGIAGIDALVERFYAWMDQLPQAREIRRMYPDDLALSKDKLARFLCGWLGGPKRYQEVYGSIRIPAAHARFEIGAAERDAWLECMRRAVDEQPYAEGFKAYLLQQLAVPAERIRAASLGS
jgi:hemoglobin